MIPSLLQIPSAVSDSKLHSVLPNNGKGDFQFERSTGATRINKDGLIEEVGYFSSELVQNGDFSELGSELVTNGDFATDSDWNKGNKWTISGGTANKAANATSNISQVISGISGKTIRVSYEVSNYVSGDIGASADGNNFNANNGNGTFVEYIIPNSDNLYIRASYSFVGSIDNVSVKQVDPNDRWSTQGDVTFSLADFQGKSQVAKVNINDTSTGSRLRQAFNYVSGAKYKISVEVYLVNGSFRVDSSDSFAVGNAGSNDFVATTTTGSWINLEANFDAVATGSDYIWIRSTSQVAEFYVSNISVVEVQGDRPRLSYDITNGVVEKQPHLLLEPSSTNLITQSNNVIDSDNVFSNMSGLINQVTSPEGVKNAGRLIENTANSDHYFQRGLAAISSSSYYTVSFFAKYNGRGASVNIGASRLYAHFDLQAGTVIASGNNSDWQNLSADIINYGNGWYKCVLTGQSVTGVAGYIRIHTNNGITSSYTSSYTGDGNSGIFIYGIQFEQQAYCTSYIPTAGTTITRAAETCNNSKPSVNSTEGVLYAEIQGLNNGTNQRWIALGSGSNANRVSIHFNATNNISCSVRGTSSARYDANFNIGSQTNNTKAAIKYKDSDYAFFVNGVKVDSQQSNSLNFNASLSELAFDSADGASNFYGKVKGLAVYNEALSESQLMQLTGVTASSIYSNFVTRTASFTVEALNEVKKVIDNL